jgi:hypothetical protein
MSEDQRLPGLPAEVQQLLNAERRPVTPPAGARDRVRARVGVTLGLAAAATGAATTAKAASGAGGLFSLKVLVPLGLGAFLVGGYVVPRLLQRPAPVAAPVVALPAPPVAETPPTVMEPAPVETAPVVESESAAPRPAVRAAPPGLAQERRALDEARTLINHGGAVAGLAALQRHQKDFPRGQLAEERDALRVMALAQLGRSTEAREAARAFSRRHPGSVLQSAVDAALASIR